MMRQEEDVAMTIKVDAYGNAVWVFYRKSYRKARWRRVGQRLLDEVQRCYPGYSGLIVVV